MNSVVNRRVPSILRGAIIGSATNESLTSALNAILQYMNHQGDTYLCSPSLHSLLIDDSRFTIVGGLPKPTPNCVIILEDVEDSAMLRALLNRDDISWIILSQRFNTMPSIVRWLLNFAVLFPLSKVDVLRFHRQEIFGMSLNIFKDMCKFIWDSSDHNYLAVNLNAQFYLKNFRYLLTWPEDD